MIDKLLSDKLCMSAEVFPPKKDGMIEGIVRTLKQIEPLKPDYVSITYGANGSGGDKTADACSISKDAFDLETVAHITTVNLTKDKLEEILDAYKRKGIYNLLPLRGDLDENSKFYDFSHADELAYYIKKNHPQFRLFGACYPEGHPESKELTQDIEVMKRKQDYGVEFFVTQLFLDNTTYYTFKEQIAKKGYKFTITCGIMPIVKVSQVSRIVSMCGTEIPQPFSKVANNKSDEEMYKVGINYAKEQIYDLIKNGEKNIHLYTMNRGDVASEIFKEFDRFRWKN